MSLPEVVQGLEPPPEAAAHDGIPVPSTVSTWPLVPILSLFNAPALEYKISPVP